ncbi:MAG: DUF429 domain-containing protein [Candidatus Aenigmatarchaeota archaeon]
MKVVGLDLAGKEENDTGFCLLDGCSVRTEVLKTDVEILEVVKGVNPDLIALDAPLGFPEDGMYRDCDEELKEKGYDVLSPNFPGMKVLVRRAKSLVEKLKTVDGFEIIEVFPRASEDNLQVRRTENLTEDEFDALVCALTGKKYLRDEHEDLKGIIVPVEQDE